MNGWIKLHQKVIDNEIWRRDRTAWHIFEYLLLKAYSGTPQGTLVTTRVQIAEVCDSNNNTVYKALRRLQNAKMITTTATNKYTKIKICNWQNYQNSNSTGNNKVTTEQQQSNTLYKNIDKDNRTITNVIGSEPQTSYGSSDVNAVMEKLYTYLDVKPVRIQKQRIAASNLIRRHGLDTTLSLIDAYKYLQQSDIYTVKVASMEDLWNKQNDILLQIKKKKSNQIARI